MSYGKKNIFFLLFFVIKIKKKGARRIDDVDLINIKILKTGNRWKKGTTIEGLEIKLPFLQAFESRTDVRRSLM
jgi:hypothetical protein